MLDQKEIVEKIKQKYNYYVEVSSPSDLTTNPDGIKIALSQITNIRMYSDIFFINKYTSKDFFNLVFEGDQDKNLENLIKIFNIYASLDYLMFSTKVNEFNVSNEIFNAKFINRPEPAVKKEKENEPYKTNLCNEIVLSAMMTTTLGMKDVGFSYQELYENVVYPQFQEMIKKTIDVEIKDITEFNDDMLDLVKMVKI